MNAKKLLTGVVLGGIVMLAPVGCTVGMFGDQGASMTHVNLLTDAKPAISADAVDVKDLSIKGVQVSQSTIDKYIANNYPDATKIANIEAAGGGYGDTKKKAIERAKRRAASVGANVIIVTDERERLNSGLMALEGAGGTQIHAIALSTNKS